jgi:hypothetical protein
MHQLKETNMYWGLYLSGYVWRDTITLITLMSKPVLRIRIRIRIHWIRMFLGLLDPDPDPSIIMQK